MLASLFKTTSTSLVNLKQKTALNTSGISAPNWSAFELSETWSRWGMDHMPRCQLKHWTVVTRGKEGPAQFGEARREEVRLHGSSDYLDGETLVLFAILCKVYQWRSVWSCLYLFNQKAHGKRRVPWSWFRKGDMFVEVEEIMVTTAPTAVVRLISGHFGPKAIQK